MNECICSSCKNLKCNIPDDTDEFTFDCEYGFPSGKCETCEETECDEAVNCSNYKIDNNEEDFVIVNCKKCGKELKKAFADNTEGDIMCITCYLEEN
jgi:hypothetical protein